MHLGLQVSKANSSRDQRSPYLRHNGLQDIRSIGEVEQSELAEDRERRYYQEKEAIEP
jgi:hypothetical protein